MNWLYLGLIGYAFGTIGLRAEPPGPFSPLAAWRLTTEVVKGATLYCICALLFGLSGWFLAISFAAYAVGRRFPIHRRFQGDPAIEAGTAFLLSILTAATASGGFRWEYLAVAVGVAAALSVTRSWQVPILAVSLLIGILFPLADGDPALTPAVVLASAYLFGEALFSIIREELS